MKFILGVLIKKLPLTIIHVKFCEAISLNEKAFHTSTYSERSVWMTAICYKGPIGTVRPNK